MKSDERNYGLPWERPTCGLLHWVLAASWALPTETIVLTGGWRATPWGACTESADAEAARNAVMPEGCTAGRQSRNVTCGLADGVVCIGAEPEGFRTCGHGDLCGYTVSAWTLCNAECGLKGSQSRTAHCTAPLLPGACKSLSIVMERDCISEANGCDWYRSEWGECSNSCGAGRQTRHVACLKTQGCFDEKPATERTCEGDGCTWIFSPWTPCSRGCGQYGSQERTKICPKEGACSGTPSLSQTCLGGPCPTPAPAPSSTTVSVRFLSAQPSSTALPSDSKTTLPLVTPVPSGGVVLEFTWFLGRWTECGGPCGTWMYKTREVYCHRTCSVYRCPKAEFAECTALYTIPPSIEDCGIMSPGCTTTTPAITSTDASAPSSTPATTVTAASTPSTTVASGSNGGSSGGGTSPVNPDDWECLVVLGQKVSATTCVTGDRAGELCGAGCPCCRRKVDLGGTSGSSSVVTPTSEEEESFTSILIVALATAGGTGILIALAYGCWHCRRSANRGPEVLKAPSLKSLTESQRSREFNASYSNPHDEPRRDAWGVSFEQPPDVDIDFRDLPPKPGEVDPRSGRSNEDDSTDDSEHEREDPFRIPVHGRSRTEQPSRAHMDMQYKKTRTTPDAGSQRGAKSNLKAAADAAFDEGLRAGKEREPHERRSEKKRSRSGSAHPKGTAVPPRPRDTTSPSPESETGSQQPKASSSPPGSASGPPPSSSSSSSSARPPSSGAAAGGHSTSGAAPTRAKATVTQDKADDGVETAVNEHILKLDADLDATRAKDLEWRKKNFKTLLLKWHPDKNTGGMGEAESAAQANEVFKHLLARRDRYLAE